MYGMRRMILAVALLAAATAYAIDTTHHPTTIALLAPAEKWPDPRDGRDFDAFRTRLKDELNALGYDAFLRDDTIKDFGPDRRPVADYYVDMVGAGGAARPAVAVGAGPVGVGFGIGHLAASLNIYDGRSVKLIDTVDPHKRTTVVTPVSFALGGRSFFTVMAMPIFEWAQNRNALRLLAHDAARQIDEALRR